MDITEYVSWLLLTCYDRLGALGWLRASTYIVSLSPCPEGLPATYPP
jgi:hypothetical protein